MGLTWDLLNWPPLVAFKNRSLLYAKSISYMSELSKSSSGISKITYQHLLQH